MIKRGLLEADGHQAFTVLQCEQSFYKQEYCNIMSQFSFLDGKFLGAGNCYQLLQISQLWVRTSVLSCLSHIWGY